MSGVAFFFALIIAVFLWGIIAVFGFAAAYANPYAVGACGVSIILLGVALATRRD